MAATARLPPNKSLRSPYNRLDIARYPAKAAGRGQCVWAAW
ncbi:hypothetical protein [Rhodoferax sp. WC2427]